MVRSVKRLVSTNCVLDKIFLILVLSLGLIPPIYYLYKWVWIIGYDKYWVSYFLGYLMTAGSRLYILSMTLPIYIFISEESKAAKVFFGIALLALFAFILSKYTYWIIGQLPIAPFATGFSFGLVILFGPFIRFFIPAVLLFIFFGSAPVCTKWIWLFW